MSKSRPLTASGAVASGFEPAVIVTARTGDRPSSCTPPKSSRFTLADGGFDMATGGEAGGPSGRASAQTPPPTRTPTAASSIIHLAANAPPRPFGLLGGGGRG